MLKVIGWIILAFLITVAIYVGIWCCQNLIIPALDKVQAGKAKDLVSRGVGSMKQKVADLTGEDEPDEALEM
jgi:hypothetical protein